MLRNVASKVAWVGRTASMVFGLALVLALVVGLASTALSATGGNFILGQNNAADVLTRLTGNVNGSAMQVVNNNADANDSALSLIVQSGEAPMRVNATAGKATNLDADKLDGEDSSQFVPTTTYTKTLSVPTNGEGGTDGSGLSCDQGDVLLSGGVKLNNAANQEIVQSRPEAAVPNSWFASVKDDTTPGPGAGFDVTVLCADLGEAHTG